MFGDRTGRCIPTNTIAVFCNSDFKLSTRCPTYDASKSLHMILYTRTTLFFVRSSILRFRILLHLDKFIQTKIRNFNVLPIKLIEFVGYRWNKWYNEQDVATFDFSFSLLQSCTAAPPHCMLLILSLTVSKTNPRG